MSNDIAWICSRIAELLVEVDRRAPLGKTSQRTGAMYLPGVPALSETDVRDLLVSEWTRTRAADFEPVGAVKKEVPYPRLPRARCDILFSTAGWKSDVPEWAIELKRIQFIGDNGKNNDFNVQKMLSPYLKDRSLIHDIERMRNHPLASRHAVVAYAFSYSFSSCDEATARHPSQIERIQNVRDVCRKNDPVGGVLSSDDLIDVANLFFTSRGVVRDSAVVPFANLWRHPCGGSGNVFGWEVA